MNLASHYNGDYETVSFTGCFQKKEGGTFNGEEFVDFFESVLEFVESKGFVYGGGVIPEEKLK